MGKNIQGPRPVGPKHLNLSRIQQAKLNERLMQRTAVKRSFFHWCEEAYNPIYQRSFKTLKELQRQKKKTESKKQEDLSEAIEESSQADESATEFQKRNPEFEKNALLSLLNSLKKTDSPEEILRKVLEYYPDYTLADEALDYLIETTKSTLNENTLIAKELLNQRYEREIKAGKNIALEAREFSKQLGSPTSLRELYRDVTGNPRTPIHLFDELLKEYPFSKLKTVIRFLLHSLGSDLKSKGPSISRAELSKLFEDTRSLQAILGVFKFFKGRMPLIYSQFSSNNLFFPPTINFEELAKKFISLFSERYITSDKVLKLAEELSISKEILAQIIVFSQMRDAVRNVAPRLYKKQKQKEDLLEALYDALEELEEELEEKEEEENE